MTPGEVVILLASVVLVMVSCLQLLLLAALTYIAKKIKATDDVWLEINRQTAYVEELAMQLVKLRTKKAGQRSAAKREEVAAATEQPDDDPFLEGLTDEDKALFR